ncbi:hypothetical protein MMC26_003095 [Xylographa opegraphella]|nr:hypothetical protein [Xylographa opegraphella]
MAALMVVVTVSVTVAVGAEQLAVAVGDDELDEANDGILGLESDAVVDLELELKDEVLELENGVDRVDGVEELELVLEDGELELENDEVDKVDKLELRLEEDVLEFESDGTDEVDEPRLELEEVDKEEVRGTEEPIATEFEKPDDEDGVTGIDEVEADEEILLMLEVVVARVLELTTIE